MSTETVIKVFWLTIILDTPSKKLEPIIFIVISQRAFF